MRTPTKDQFRGAILGLAVGDALGFPVEFMDRKAIQSQYGVLDKMIPNGSHQAGTYSDDTQMTIAVAEALLEPFDTMDEMAKRFIAWSLSPENNRAPGNACMSGCAQLAMGALWSEAGNINSKGCGSAMRVAPIGLRFWNDEAKLLSVARNSSLLTHRHPAAIDGARAAALLVSAALQGDSPPEMYRRVLALCENAPRDFDECWQLLAALLAAPPELVLSKEGLGEAWVAEEAVASAMYCYTRNESSFRATIIEAANTDGDSDSIACITGGISGAALGASAIPEEWLEPLENREGLTALADALFEAAV